MLKEEGREGEGVRGEREEMRREGVSRENYLERWRTGKVMGASMMKRRMLNKKHAPPPPSSLPHKHTHTYPRMLRQTLPF